MNLKGNTEEYGRLAQGLHWLSAILILFMIPMGFYMARINNDPFLYRGHLLSGLLVLILTITRILWVFVDERPDPPSNMTPLHFRVYKIVHILLYVSMTVMVFSGLVMFLTTDLSNVLFGSDVLPKISQDIPPRMSHFLFAVIMVILLVLHIGGVFLHQFTKGDLFGRMGVKRG